MAIEISERFCVEAPIEVVWPFVKDPRQLVTCMPGASLDEVVDERTFTGTVKVKLGALTTKYKGRVEFAEVDEAAHSVLVVAEGREAGGGTARGQLSSRLRSLSDGRTEVVAEGGVDLTGRVMQVGRGMIQGVSEQLFQEFAESTKSRLEHRQAAEAGAGAVVDGAGAGDGYGSGPEADSIRVVPLVLKTTRRQLLGILRRFARWLGRRLLAWGEGRSGSSSTGTDFDDIDDHQNRG